MARRQDSSIAIVDYGLGNLFSIKQACELTGMKAEITSSKKTLAGADTVILPGVGAFGDAMSALKSLDLIDTIRQVAESGKLLIGICLGLQLLFSESSEFGSYKGLDIIEGKVVRFEKPRYKDFLLKVPQIGWNRISSPNGNSLIEGEGYNPSDWKSTLLDGVGNGSYMYFVHSYYGIPDDPGVILSKTTYGDIEYCSGLKKRNVYGFQFHPERSGHNGLKVYRNLHTMLSKNTKV